MNDRAPERGEPRQILIVEDVDALRMLLRLQLEQGGAEVEEARTLQAARAALRRGYEPELVLLDLELGDGLGLDLIKELPSAASVHVLTADTTQETKLRCEQAGCSSVIDKAQDLRAVAEGLLHSDHEPLAARRMQSDLRMERRYIEFLAETRIRLATAIEKGERDVLRAVAHRLRGTAVHFGYAGLSANALSLSRALRARNAAETSVAVTHLNQQISEALESFQYRQESLTRKERAI